MQSSWGLLEIVTEPAEARELLQHGVVNQCDVGEALGGDARRLAQRRANNNGLVRDPQVVEVQHARLHCPEDLQRRHREVGEGRHRGVGVVDLQAGVDGPERREVDPLPEIPRHEASRQPLQAVEGGGPEEDGAVQDEVLRDRTLQEVAQVATVQYNPAAQMA